MSLLIELFISQIYNIQILEQNKQQLEQELRDLNEEKSGLEEHLNIVVITDGQIVEIEAICAEINLGLDNATIEDKHRYFDLLEVRGTVALEDGKETVYIKCKLGVQQVLQMQTSP